MPGSQPGPAAAASVLTPVSATGTRPASPVSVITGAGLPGRDRCRQPVLSDPLTPSSREAGSDGGRRGVYAHPLAIGGAVAGALGLYTHEPRLLPPPVQRIAAQFAEPAALLLGGVTRRVSQEQVIAQLHDAIESRTIIG